jgi:hypothetical protein
MKKCLIEIIAKGGRVVATFERYGDSATDAAKMVVAQMANEWCPFVDDGKDEALIFRSTEIEAVKATKI